MNPSRPYPVFLLIEGKPCLVAGGGKVAHRKTLDLLECGASVTVVAETPAPEMEELVSLGAIRLIPRRVEPDDVLGTILVFAATDDEGVNAAIAGYARARGILVNVVDNPAFCDFTTGAVVKRGPLRIAVSTSGCGPRIAAGIRRELEDRYGESFGEYVALAGELRTRILSEPCSKERKNEALRWLAGGAAYDRFLGSGKEAVWKEARTILFSS